MIRLSFVLLGLMALSACREELAGLPGPVALSAESVGHYCQMDLLEHEGPKAQAHLEGLTHPLFFSQVRDVVAYQRMPEQSHALRVAYVSDMGAPGASWAQPGATNWIRADEAFYVVGSAIAGGMGAPELVPFSRAEDAAAFATANGGTVMGLADIPDTAVLAPLESDTGGSDENDAEFQRRLHALGHGN